jgi:hypothetical protein
MYCKICGDENVAKAVYRFWSPDDGYVAGRLCEYCKETALAAEPKSTDYAYDNRQEPFADVDDAMSTIYG